MKTTFFKILALLCFILLHANLYGQAQQPGRASVTGINEKDSIKIVKESSSLATQLLFSGDGIALFKDAHPTAEEAQAGNACKPASGVSTSRCGTFTVPANQPYSRLGRGGWLYYNYTSETNQCLPGSWTGTLRDSTGNLIPEPWYVAPGKTYNYCLSVTLSNGACTATSFCLTPYALEVKYDLEHYYKKDNTTKFLHKLPDNSLFFPRDFMAVSADGSNVSEFRITGQPAQNSLNWKLRIKEDPTGANAAKYGIFTFVSNTTAGIKFNYTHPTIPPSATNKSYEEYNIELIDAANANIVVKVFKIRIYRVPLLMVHGKADNNTAYLTMYYNLGLLGLYDFDLMLSADYKSTNNEHFVINQKVVKNHIDRLLGNVLLKKIAAGKVDIVAHSMGGLLSRIYLQSDEYRQDINKLITHNTPHSGAQSANRLADPIFGATNQGKVARYFGDYGGAAIDLQVGPENTIATTINISGRLNKNKVPTHAIATTHPYNPEDPDSPNPGVKYTALVKGLGMTPNALFRNDASDLVVPLESQLGGLTGTNRTILTPQVHSQAQENSQVINRIKELLIANPKENLFTQNGYAPANNLQYIPPPSFAPIANTIPNGTIDIIQPLNNKTVNLGSQLQFIVNGTNLSSISVYIKVTEGNWIELTAQGNNLNQITTITNIYKVGTYEFIALGNCTNGEPIFKEGKFTVTNCIDNYNPLVGEIINPYYQAKNKIVASGQLVFGQPVVMTAGQSIEFKPGFVADTYTTLEAKIKACDN